MRVIVMRHARAENNDLAIASEDPNNVYNLTEVGREQANAAGILLRDWKIDLIITSELTRAKQTAEAVNKHQNAPVEVDPRLNDRVYGIEGQNMDVVHERMKNENYETFVPPGGESFIQIKERIFSFIEDLKKRDVETVLVVTHYQPVEIFLIYQYNLSFEDRLKLYVKNASFYVLNM